MQIAQLKGDLRKQVVEIQLLEVIKLLQVNELAAQAISNKSPEGLYLSYLMNVLLYAQINMQLTLYQGLNHPNFQGSRLSPVSMPSLKEN